jgi:putative flavoprotein involved in K+ transport
LRPRTTDASGTTVSFEDGTTLDVSSVIWATGFDLDHSWVDVPVFDDNGQVVHRRGVTALPGLYFLGLPWLYTRGSALLGWVQHDARYLAEQIDTARRGKPILAAPPASTNAPDRTGELA